MVPRRELEVHGKERKEATVERDGEKGTKTDSQLVGTEQGGYTRPHCKDEVGREEETEDTQGEGYVKIRVTGRNVGLPWRT